MTYEDAVFNALQGKGVPYRKETKSKLKELLPIAKEKDGVMRKFYSDRLIELANKPIPHFGKYLWDENLGRNKMSKFNVGDKFEIEIAEVFKGAESGNDKYRIKGFDNLVFDDKGLEKLTRTFENTQYYKYIYSVKYDNGKWFDPVLDYEVPIMGSDDGNFWSERYVNEKCIGASVVATAKTKAEADLILAEEMKERNKQ